MKWSFSALKDYINCPRSYHEVKVKQAYVKPDTAQTLYGKAVHLALEMYVRDGTPLPAFYESFRPTADILRAMPGTKYCELRLAVDDSNNPRDFDGQDYFARGILDLLIIDGDTAFLVDYKTGKPQYADTNQLKLMAIMVFAHFKQVKHIKACLLFINRSAMVEEEYTREEVPRLWAAFRPSLFKLQKSFELAHWPAFPSGLCNFCPVKSCDHWEEAQQRKRKYNHR